MNPIQLLESRTRSELVLLSYQLCHRCFDRAKRTHEWIILPAFFCTGFTCCHAIRAVSLTSVKKVLKAVSELGTCSQCEKRQRETDGDAKEDPNTVWMCLQCGHQGCGRYSEDKHALRHHETPRSFSHALAVCPQNWSVWLVLRFQPCLSSVFFFLCCYIVIRVDCHMPGATIATTRCRSSRTRSFWNA